MVFQYLSLLFTEIYLDRYFADSKKLLAEINEFLKSRFVTEEGNWKEIEGMMNQVYGQPKQKIESVITAPKPLVDLTERKKNGE